MSNWAKIGWTLLILLIPILLLTYGNGLAEDFKIRIPGLGIILALGVVIAIRAVWRWKPVKDQD